MPETVIAPSGGGSGGSGTPGGADTQVQFNDAGAFGGDADLTWTKGTNTLALGGADTGVVLQKVTNEPAAPGANLVRIYGQSDANRIIAKMRHAAGAPQYLQPAWFSNSIALVQPGATTVPGVAGIPATTNVGTVSHPTPTSTNLLSQARRIQVVSAGAGNSVSEIRETVAYWWVGNAAGLGGFFFNCCYGFTSTVAGQRHIVGLTASTGAIATTQSPSSLTDCVFFGNDAADTNWQFMNNDNAGTCTKADLGASFTPQMSNELFDFTIYCPPNGATIGYRAVRLSDGSVAEGTVSSNLPTNTTFLTFHVYMNNNAVASAVTLAFTRLYLESDT